MGKGIAKKFKPSGYFQSKSFGKLEVQLCAGNKKVVIREFNSKIISEQIPIKKGFVQYGSESFFLEGLTIIK